MEEWEEEQKEDLFPKGSLVSSSSAIGGDAVASSVQLEKLNIAIGTSTIIRLW